MTTTSTSSIRRTGKRRKGFIPILSSEASTSIRSMLFIGISVWLLSIGRMDLPLPTLPFRLYCPRHPTRLWALRNEDDRRWTVAAVTRARQKEATVFATTEIRKVPVTVLSRCQRFDLRRISLAQLTEQFLRICEKEQAKADPEAVKLIAIAADGSVRDGLSL